MRATGIIASLAGILALAQSALATDVPPLGTRYLHTDPGGDVFAMSNAEGGITFRAAHRPWGEHDAHTAGASWTRRSFGGWEDDTATGLLYAGARHYDATLARFLSVDPAGQAVYVALGDAPLEFVDPDGCVWYRMFLEDDTAAFSLWRRGIHIKVSGITPREVGRDTRQASDVFFYDVDRDCAEWRTWDLRFMNGRTREDFSTVDKRRAIVDGYYKEKSIPPGKRDKVGAAMRRWMNYHKMPDAGPAVRDRSATHAAFAERLSKRPRTEPRNMTLATVPGTQSGFRIVRPVPRRPFPVSPGSTTSSRVNPQQVAAAPSHADRQPYGSQRDPWFDLLSRPRSRQSLLAELAPQMPTSDPMLGNWLWPPR